MMDLIKLKGLVMDNRVFTVSLLIATCSLIFSVTFYSYSKLKTIEKNVESAIVKGIDPIAVRCAYSVEKDMVCVAYAASHPQQIQYKSSK